MKALQRLSAAEKWVLVMTALTLVLALANLGRAVVAMRYAAQIPELQLPLGPAYTAGSGVFWGAALLICAGGLLTARPWGRLSTLIAVTLYQTHVWFNRLRFDASDYARQTRPRDLVLTGSLLLLYWGTLSLRPVRRVFWEDAGDDERSRSGSADPKAARKETDL